MLGYALNKNTNKVDMTGEYNMVKAFVDPSCYRVLTEEELEDFLNGDL